MQHLAYNLGVQCTTRTSKRIAFCQVRELVERAGAEIR
jgi:hypothetical protein